MNKVMTLTIVAFVAIVTVASTYAVVSVVKGQASVLQSNQGSDAGGSTLGEQIAGMTQDIIGRTNQQVQNTLDQAGVTALQQLQPNASSYDCIVVIMHFGQVHGAMTCSDNQSNALSLSSNGGGSASVQSSIQRQSSGGNSATSMQNSITGSGSSANVIPGDVP